MWEFLKRRRKQKRYQGYQRTAGHIEREKRYIDHWLQRFSEQGTPQSQSSALARPQSVEKTAELDRLRRLAHEAFMTHPAAIEEDFVRCWPLIRDEMFKQHAVKVLVRKLAASKDPSDVEAAFRIFLAEIKPEVSSEPDNETYVV